MAVYPGSLEVIYSPDVNGPVVKNCVKENEGAFHAELKFSPTCQLTYANLRQLLVHHSTMAKLPEAAPPPGAGDNMPNLHVSSQIRSFHLPIAPPNGYLHQFRWVPR